ncbi:MAG: amidohydrolase [Oscillospiraceae bacterium]|nr:amidohydrolase [Oscillospiraceae bacterium]
MKIVDAHLHLFDNSNGWADEVAKRVGHRSSEEHLRQTYAELGMVHGVIMGNRSLNPENHSYAQDLFHYCVGFDSHIMEDGFDISTAYELAELNLRRDSCCGVKLYPGYNKISLANDFYKPIYKLAAKYEKPVAVHTGLTAHSQAHLKYCHPLVLDEVAADNSRTRFVMCHFGNPFFDGAAAVLAKNPNVCADLSGFLDGMVDLDAYFADQAGYVFLLKSWLAASNGWDKIMYGTDWPIVNLEQYINFVKRLIPEKHWNNVFFNNANRIYGLGLKTE